MGIKGLTALITDEAPKAIKVRDYKSYFGRKVGIDASMCLYQFLVAIRGNDGQNLMNEAGETTSHLMGFFYRTLRMVDNGMKPMYVFDGKPPDLKAKVLEARFGKRTEAADQAEEEKDVATEERADQLARRQVKPTKQHNVEVRELLGLMGIPCVTAPSEAEAQCAELVKAGKIYAVGSEDMDTLTFGSPVLLKYLTMAEARKMAINEVSLPDTLEGMGLTMDQFIDLCILCGCDYMEPIKGMGPKTALKLIREHGSIESVMEHIEEVNSKAAEGKKGKYTVPEFFPYKEAREIFRHPDVHKGSEVELEWKKPDVEGLVKFMCTDRGFSEDRVRKGAERLTKSIGTKQQGRLDGFFTAAPKRKAEDEEDSKANVKGKGGAAAKKAKSGAAAKGGKGSKASGSK
ncbi:PIN domain-like protein [Tilletiopsis washingtonensis]|uniref:Flap endonuclease 1 n=1 Tax=Tilletiopsis washingtonensis TaxID=58919 RepID=A0A316ZA20_9BASI|nr:PIN domain-like protein [Tilletiopsis washingtonensis]PWN97043.1 PIN domain-like protein [Tilletiopsis washingtonensis]